MRADQDFSSLLYTSAFSLSAPPDAIATIATRSRSRNLGDSITGLLAFDGWSFLQLVEGPLEAIARLLQRLRADDRHRAMDILALTAVSELRFPDWSLGYLTFKPGEHGIHSLKGLRGAKALDAFDKLLPMLARAAGHGGPLPSLDRRLPCDDPIHRE